MRYRWSLGALIAQIVRDVKCLRATLAYLVSSNFLLYVQLRIRIRSLCQHMMII